MQALSQLSYSPDIMGTKEEDEKSPGLGGGTSLLKEARPCNPGSRSARSEAAPITALLGDLHPQALDHLLQPEARQAEHLRGAWSGCRGSWRAPPGRAPTRARRRATAGAGRRPARRSARRARRRPRARRGRSRRRRARARGAPRSRAAGRCPGQGNAMSFAIAARVTFTPRPAACLRREVLEEQRDVLGPLAQRRHAERDDVEPVEEVFAERARARPSPRDRGASRR